MAAPFEMVCLGAYAFADRIDTGAGRVGGVLTDRLASRENVVRALLREAGIRPGAPARSIFAAAVRACAQDDDAVMAMVTPLLKVPGVMFDQLAALRKQVPDVVCTDPVCHRLMGMPGVGAHLGLTPSRYQSGETDRQGHISTTVAH